MSTYDAMQRSTQISLKCFLPKTTTNYLSIKKRVKLGQFKSKNLTFIHDLATKFNQLKEKAVKLATQIFLTFNDDRKHLSYPRKVIKQQIDPHTCT